MAITAAIETCVETLQQHPSFEEWKNSQSWMEGDLCVLNSSFLLRDGVKTNQAIRRLVLKSDSNGKLSLGGTVDLKDKMVSPFKRLVSASIQLPDIKPLEAAIEEEQGHLGEVLFCLVGDLAPSAVGEVKVSGLPEVKFIRLNTSQFRVAKLENEMIIVNNTHDEDAIWNELGENFDAATHRPVLAKFLEELEDEASREVSVPEAGTKPVSPLLRELCSGLETQALEYQEALDLWVKSDHKDEGALHQILRISYNFASDAVRLIRLTISVCDLKPLVFWCTIDKHLSLDTAIKALPWQTHSKASLGAYVKIVNAARNHAFHDLFPVVSGLNVELPDAALRKIRLRLFSRHGSKRHRNEVRFEDQELVDLLTEFTRAGHRVTPPSFWKRNLDTMQASLELLEETTRSLILLRANS
jgi:hypothetical protein